VIWIVFVIPAVVVSDAIWARNRLRLRSRHPAPTAAHQLVGTGSGGRHGLDEDTGTRDETEVANPFSHRLDAILGANARREPPRR
jgi:hypothetical protein